jgi:iron complex outermembrane recepter protein
MTLAGCGAPLLQPRERVSEKYVDLADCQYPTTSGRTNLNRSQQTISLAIRTALALGGLTLTAAAAAQTAAPAQQTATNQPPPTPTPPPPPPNKTVTLQGVTVTGSLIRSVDVETAQPVTELSHEALQQQGFISVGQILQNISSVGSSGTSNQSVLGNIVGQYASLRGLGAPRTLVLVDGQRWTTDIFGQTDLSTVPSSIIDHVEILQDGASAIYGSDAIAGVINIITKKDFDGLQLDTYNSTYSPGGDGRQSQFSLTGGKKFSRGSFLVNITVQNQNALNASDRWYSQYGINSLGPNYPQTQGPTDYGQIIGALNPATGQPETLPQLQNSLNNAPLIVNPGGNGMNIANYHPDTFGVIYPSPTFAQDYANTAAYNTLVPNSRLRSYTLKGDYKLTDHITANFTGTYNTNYSVVMTGGYPLGSNTVVNGNNLAAALGLPAGTFPQSYLETLSAQSYYNPLPGNNLQFILPLIQPNRVTYNKIKQAGFRVGLEGDFAIGERLFNWDAGYSDYRYDQSSFGPGNLNMVHAYLGLGPSFMQSNGQVVCGTPGNVIAGCVPINPFSGAGGLTPAETNYLNMITGTRSFSEARNISANLSGDVVTLPDSFGAGDVTFAIGADHRDISGAATPDMYSQLGLNTNLQQNPGEGSYGINEAYAELNVPLLKDMTAAQLLDFDVAHRFSHYSNFGDTNNNQYKLSWKPIDDLLVRASYGTGFRAPSIANLYGGTMQSFTTFTDPCDVTYGLTGNPTVAARCLAGFGGLPAVGPGFNQLTASGVPVSNANAPAATPFLAGANPALRPETSKSYTAGFVYSPNWLSGFNITADFYRIRIDNVITLPTATSILDNCYLLGITQQCTQFQRNAQGQVVNLLQALINEGFVDERGEDITMSYLFPDTPVGKFKIDTNGTYINSVKEQAAAGAPVVSNTLGSYDAVLGPLWRFRDTTNINWNYRGFGATWTIRYYSSLTESCRPANPSMDLYFPCNMPNADLVASPNGLQRQGALAFNDLQVNWDAPWKGRIALGATNVFNRRAPQSFLGVFQIAGPLGPTGTDGFSQYAYNPMYDIGRVIYLKYEQKFF